MKPGRGFGLGVAVLLLAVALVPLLAGRPLRWWALAAMSACLLPALARPALLVPLERSWIRLGELLQQVVNPLLMALVFLVVVTPMGLILRLLGRDPPIESLIGRWRVTGECGSIPGRPPNR